MEADFPDGVRFVELAATTRPELVATALADQLGVRSSATGESVVTMLESFLQTLQLLLVVDNFEQVSRAAPLVTDLLTAAPGVKVLVTSRTVLNLGGEHDVAVLPLRVRVGSGQQRGAGSDPSTRGAPGRIDLLWQIGGVPSQPCPVDLVLRLR